MISVFRIRPPVHPTIVYDSYWHFAAERQQTFLRRLGGGPPYSDDPIIRQHRFTNAYRAADRVSQFLIQEVVYSDEYCSVEDIFFRTLLFRIFNKVETWIRLSSEVGEPSWSSYDFHAYDRTLTNLLQRKDRIYSAAYIMPSRAGKLNSPRKHRNHLRLLEQMMADSLPQRIADASSAAAAFKLLRSYPMIGNFLGYQFLTDLNYGPLLSFSEMDFVVAGPGALGGLRKCFSDTADLAPADLIRLATESQEDEFHRRSIDFQSLWGRRLQLIDCQNLFCEIDKYARAAHPEFNGAKGRSRIKQGYKPNREPLRLWFPPKWGINHRIPDHALAERGS